MQLYAALADEYRRHQREKKKKKRKVRMVHASCIAILS